MDRQPLNLEHQELLEQKFQLLQSNFSEYTFANLYLFRDVHQYELIKSAKDLYIKGRTREGLTFLMLTTPIEKVDFEEITYLLKTENAFLFPIREKWLHRFDTKIFRNSFLESDSDYLYTVAKLSTYAGRHLSGRRNLVNQFNDLFPVHRDECLDSTKKEEALAVLQEWHAHAKEEPFTDYSSCLEAIHLFERLHLTGHITYVDDKPVAFLIGEPLNEKAYVIHFAKALIQYKGIYQYLYQSFAKALKNKNQFHCINLEQDLGSAELKHAKRSYQPDKYAIKYRVNLIE